MPSKISVRSMISMRTAISMRSTVLMCVMISNVFNGLNAFNGLVAGPWIRSHTSGVRDATRRASTKAELGGNQGPAGSVAASAGGEAASLLLKLLWLLLK